jgi:2'-5' RNA ligase
MKERLFFAFMPDEAALAQTLRAAEHVRSLNPSGHWRPIAPARLHVTAQFVGTFEGGVPPEILEAATAAGAALVHEPFTVEFDRVDAFGRHVGDAPIVLLGEGVHEAVRFNQGLREAMAAADLGEHATGPFTPHVTLAYGDRIDAYVLPEAVRWIVGRLVLLKGRDWMAEYEEVAGWELGGR